MPKIKTSKPWQEKLPKLRLLRILSENTSQVKKTVYLREQKFRLIYLDFF